MTQTQTSSARPYHTPVMVKQVVRALTPVSPGLVIDATFGGGGHSRALLAASPGLRILAIDRDPDATEHVRESEDLDRLRLIMGNFGDLETVLRSEVPDAKVRGALLDLGVSSHQLDEPERGFSYRAAGPLDMRMGPDAAHRAEVVVNSWTVEEVARILREYGEERFARRIAGAIVAARPIADTAALAQTVANAVPAAARRARHPARKTFQAIRIAVNGELDALRTGLDVLMDAVSVGGRIAVIAYHSLEDRIVKRRFAVATSGCECPEGLPVCMCAKKVEFRYVLPRAVKPADTEVASNPRCRSAILRVVERVDV